MFSIYRKYLELILGQRRLSDNTWLWVNNNAYINNGVQLSWIPGRPDDDSGNCLQIANQAAYSNEDCSAIKPYICARPIGSNSFNLT
jgi:hypothetical protein